MRIHQEHQRAAEQHDGAQGEQRDPLLQAAVPGHGKCEGGPRERDEHGERNELNHVFGSPAVSDASEAGLPLGAMSAPDSA